MTGTNKSYKSISSTGDQLVDGVISGDAWGGTSITYAFPTLTSDYSYTTETSNNFGAISTAQRAAALFAMEKSYGGAANDGFSVEGFTNLAFSQGSATTSNLRFAQSDAASPTAYAYYPGTYAQAGDIWFSTAYAGTSNDYRTPEAGNYAWHTLIHELGHALGLKHGHETDVFGAVPSSQDSIEYTVMTYRSFVGDDINGYNYEEFGAPQTFMMADIAALQEMYGADFTTNSGNTTYKWSPTSGRTLVNGDVAISPGANRIFATIWDGDGTDTFDLSAYTTGVRVDLRPGKASLFDDDQLANLDYGSNLHYARGNIFNALLYEGDTRSLIENAKGGSGNDVMVGNQVANALRGYSGNDTLKGDTGNDKLYGGLGADRLTGGTGADRFVFSSVTESKVATSARDIILDFSSTQRDRIDLSVIDANTTAGGNQAFSYIGTAGFTGKAGELRYTKAASDTYIYGDTNGDRTPDFAVRLDDAVTLVKGYFIV